MAQLVKPPQFWTKEEVRNWITWCIDEYALDLSESQLDSFQMNGKALLMLNREDFCQRAPALGDVIFNALQKLACQSRVTSSVTSHPVTRDAFNDSLLWTNIPMTSSVGLTRDNCSVTRSKSRPPDGQYDVAEDDLSGPAVTSAVELNCLPEDLSHADSSTNIITKKRKQQNAEPINEAIVLPLKKRTLRKRERPKSEDCDGEDTSSVHSSKTSDINWQSDDTDVYTTDDTIVKEEPAVALDLSSDVNVSCTPDYSSAPDGEDVLTLDSVSPFTEVCPVDQDSTSSVKDECAADSKCDVELMRVCRTEVNAGGTSNVTDEPTNKEIPTAQNKLLWEFISELLEQPSRDKPVRWLDQSTLTFRISDPSMLAEMWGEQKRKGNMTYEKLSRALRYYYKMKIISKVPGKKLTYRYLTPPPNIIKGVRGAKPGVPHKRRKHCEATPSVRQDKEPEILDLSIKKHKRSTFKSTKKKTAATKHCSSTVTSATDRTEK